MRCSQFSAIATLSIVAMIALVTATPANVTIGPGADLSGATGSDTANEERLNVDRSNVVTLFQGTYNVLDFQLNVANSDTGTGNAGTITPMLVAGSPSSYSTLWIGNPFDPTTTGQQTAEAYAGETFTLTSPTTVYGGIFTGNNGGAIPSLTTASGTTDHDNNFTTPTTLGQAVDSFSHAGLGRAYAFEINIDAGLEDVIVPPVVSPGSGNSSAVSTDLLQTDFDSVVNVGVGGPAGGDGPDGLESVLRDGTATDTSGYANGSTTAARISDDDVLTYSFDTTTNPFGYQINQIDLFHGWKDGGRDNISDFDVAYSLVGDPGTFYDILVGGDSGNYADSYGRTSVMPGAGNTFLATNVSTLRITFNDIENGYGGISEIDVLGFAIVPEPSTFALAALAFLGLIGFSRRRKQR